MPRESRKKQEIDVSRFAPLVAEALRAFGTHVAYAEAMSRAAVTIERKRAVWKTRTNAAKAEVTAFGKKVRSANPQEPYDSEVVVRFNQDQRSSSLARSRDVDEGSES